MAARGRTSAKDKDKQDAKALGAHRVPENQKREVYERVRRAVEAKSGVCTNHKVGSSPWDKNEQRVLEDGLRYYPHDQHSNMLIYIRIAASLPKKTVRDVAHHLRHMQDTHRAKVEAETPAATVTPVAKRHHPDPAAAAAMAAMHEHQMAAMFAANAAAGMAAMQSLPGLAPALAGPSGPGPHLKDDKMEARVCTLLQENMALINSIRENMVMGRFLDNHPLMIGFDKNVKEVTALLATLPFAEMQKLPVQINPYFISGSLPSGMGPHQPGSPGPHPHALQGGGAPPPAPGGVASHPNGSSNVDDMSGHSGVAQAPVSGVDQLMASAAAAAAPSTTTVVGGAPLALQQQQQQHKPVPPVVTPAPQDLQQQQLRQHQSQQDLEQQQLHQKQLQHQHIAPPTPMEVLPNATEPLATARAAVVSAPAATLAALAAPAAPAAPAVMGGRAADVAAAITSTTAKATAAPAAAVGAVLAAEAASRAAAKAAEVTPRPIEEPPGEMVVVGGGGVNSGGGGGGGVGGNGVSTFTGNEPLAEPSGVGPPTA